MHTPGPWKSHGTNSGAKPLDDVKSDIWGDQQCIGVLLQSSARDLLECADNARLIAAAPDLLDCLRFVDGYLIAMGRESTPHPGLAQLMLRVSNAIARAEGSA